MICNRYAHLSCNKSRVFSVGIVQGCVSWYRATRTYLGYPAACRRQGLPVHAAQFVFNLVEPFHDLVKHHLERLTVYLYHNMICLLSVNNDWLHLVAQQVILWYRANGVPMTLHFTEWHRHSTEIQRNKNYRRKNWDKKRSCRMQGFPQCASYILRGLR